MYVSIFDFERERVDFNQQFFVNGSSQDIANNIKIRVKVRSSEKTQSNGVRFPFLVNLTDELNADFFFRF